MMSDYDRLKDSLKDVTAWMTELTDMEHPHLTETRDAAFVIKNLATALYYMKEAGMDESHASTHESWGDADPKARVLFETLEKHYMGFWRCAAAYQKHPDEKTKASMLEHFEHQLHAHDELAAFVMGNCPTLCAEVKTVLAKWAASKQSAKAAA